MIHDRDGFFGSCVQNRIILIHDPKRFFTTDPKIVNTARGNSKQYNIHQLIDNDTAHLKGHFWTRGMD